MITRVTILGFGLIGGSLALAWKRSLGNIELTGYDTESIAGTAKTSGMIDRVALSVAEAVSRADLVVLATPLGAMEGLLIDMAPHLRHGALVTDVGSVKMPVMAAAKKALRADNCFVGGHPMAGSEHGGLSNADAFLFENATYVLCPEDGRSVSSELTEVVNASGGRVLILDAERHDTIAAQTSHLPQLLATLLMTVAADRSRDDDAFLRLAAGGFRDMTRISSSPFNLWEPILRANEGPIMEALRGFSDALVDVMDAVEHGDADLLRGLFATARRVRSTIPRDMKGFLHPLADMYVYAEDRPGTLTHITSTLFDNGINIKDIELLKIREGTGGAFRISLIDQATAEAAVAILENAGCRAHRL